MKKKILVLCTGNSCRSQMAEGYLRHFADGKAKVCSAGTKPTGVNPNAVSAMAEDQIDISGQVSNHVDNYAGINFDYVISVCDRASENCPVFPGNAKRIHQNFPDPVLASGAKKEIEGEFRKVRIAIKKFCKGFVGDYL